MSPEQASGRRIVDHRTDIWSFGIVAYECLTGYHAFAAETLGGLLLAICSDPLPVPSHVAQVPTGFDEWFARCVNREPSLRFLSIAEAADVLRFVCGLEVSSSLAVPQLYSEPPATPYSALVPRRAHRPLAYSGGISTTDAPSILTLAESMVLRKRRNNWLYLGGLLVAGLLVAAIVRFNAGSHSSSNAAALDAASVASNLAAKRDLPVPSVTVQDPQALVAPAMPAAAPPPLPSLANKITSAGSSVSPKKLKGDSSLAKSNHDAKPILVAAGSKEENNKPSSSIGADNLVASGATPKALPPPAPVASETVENTFGLRPKKAAQGVQ